MAEEGGGSNYAAASAMDTSAARAALPGPLQYGRVRPIFARARDIRIAPTTGFTTYTSGQEIVFNLPTGNDMWLDQRNSYILFDMYAQSSISQPTAPANYTFSQLGGPPVALLAVPGTGVIVPGVNLAGIETFGPQTAPIGMANSAFPAAGGEVANASARLQIRLDANTTALVREWRTYLNGVLVEDFERPNVLHPVLEDIHSDPYDTCLRFGPMGANVYVSTGRAGSANAAGSQKGQHAIRTGGAAAPAVTTTWFPASTVAATSAAGNNLGRESCGFAYGTMGHWDGIQRPLVTCGDTIAQAAAASNQQSQFGVSYINPQQATAVGAPFAGAYPGYGVHPGFEQYMGCHPYFGGPNERRRGFANRPSLASLANNTPHNLGYNYALLPPSAVVGTGTDRMLPLAFFQSVRCHWTLEYANIAFNVQMESEEVGDGDVTTRNLQSKPAYWLYPLNFNYSVNNMYWYMRIIELDGDVLAFVADAYASDGVPRFLFPMEQWIHKYATVASNTSNPVIPFNFNITSAKGIIVVLRMEDSENYGSSSCVSQFCLTDRFGGFHLSNWQLTINGRVFPEYGPVMNYDPSVSNTSTHCADALFKAIGAVAGNIAAHTPGRITLTDFQGPGTYPLCLGDTTGGFTVAKHTCWRYGDNSTANMTRWVRNTNGGPSGAFFIGYPLEPADITEGTTSRAGVRLSAANDVSLTYQINTNAAQAGLGVAANNIPPIRVDIFVLADTEFLFEQGAVTKIGAS